MKILLTGSNGLVGSQINADINFSSHEHNLRDYDQVYELFMKNVPTHVIHCAAKVGGVLANLNYPGEFFYDNIMMNTNVLECSRIFGVKKVVSFLSTCIFPDEIEYPLTEDKIHLGPPHPSNFAYAYAKRMLDIQSRAYRKQYRMNCVSVIPCNIYGLYDNFHLQNAHVIPSLIYKCYRAIKNDEDFVVWGSGKPRREFIYSKDVGQLTNWVLENYDEEEPIILSSPEIYSIGTIAEIIAGLMGYDRPIKYDTSKPDGQFEKPSSNEKLKRYLPDFKFTPLQEGLKETIDWFVDKYPNVRGIETI